MKSKGGGDTAGAAGVAVGCDGASAGEGNVHRNDDWGGEGRVKVEVTRANQYAAMQWTWPT